MKPVQFCRHSTPPDVLIDPTVFVVIVSVMFETVLSSVILRSGSPSISIIAIALPSSDVISVSSSLIKAFPLNLDVWLLANLMLPPALCNKPSLIVKAPIKIKSASPVEIPSVLSSIIKFSSTVRSLSALPRVRIKPFNYSNAIFISWSLVKVVSLPNLKFVW